MDLTYAWIGAVACAALGAYHHVAYPTAMAVLGRSVTMPKRLPREAPSMEILMPAYNEAACIERKIDALAALDYPRDCLRVVVACDGCADDTADRARRAAKRHPGLRIDVQEFDINRGKTAVLNGLIRSAVAEIIVFSDVSAIPEPDALHRLAAWFVDPNVGAVGGGYSLPRDAGRGETLYWRYQSAIKRGESRLAGLVGAHGAFYAARRRCLTAVPRDTINDDFIIPMRIAADGWRTIYDPDIRVHEIEHVDQAADSRRRRRIGAGNFQQLMRLARPVARSGQLGLVFAFLSGKGLRVAMGPLMIVGALCLAAVASSSIAAAAGVALLLLASAAPGPGRYAVNGHLQSMIGAVEYLAGKHRAWGRVSRSSSGPTTE